MGCQNGKEAGSFLPLVATEQAGNTKTIFQITQHPLTLNNKPPADEHLINIFKKEKMVERMKAGF